MRESVERAVRLLTLVDLHARSLAQSRKDLFDLCQRMNPDEYAEYLDRRNQLVRADVVRVLDASDV